jgi:hypothetical protein
MWISASTLPNRSTQAATAAAQAAESETSVGASIIRSARAVASRVLVGMGFRSTAQTLSPWASKSSTQARPMPLAAPVTITFLDMAIPPTVLAHQ